VKYVSPKDLKVNTTDGMHSFFLPAGEPVELPEHLIAAAVVGGARPVAEGQATVAAAEDDAVVTTEADAAVELIADVMAAILAEDKPELLTSAGIPRANVVEERCGFNTTKEQRDEAWAIVEG